MTSRKLFALLALSLFSCLTLAGRAATLSGSFTSLAAGTNLNLSAAGAVDWMQWGQFSEFAFDRKTGATALITNYTLQGNPDPFSDGPFRRPNDLATGFTWNDGSQNTFATNTPTGIYILGKDNGFRITVPADTNTRVLRVYVAAQARAGALIATLSDGSASAYSPASLSAPAEGVYTITYAAGSANRTLAVTWVGTGNGNPAPNITLAAVALANATLNNPPTAALVTPVESSTWPAGSNLVLTATAADPDGSITNVAFFAGTNKLGEVTGSPYQFTWTNPPAGFHQLTVRAADNGGAIYTNRPVDLFIHATGGSLAVSAAFPPQQVNLTDEGTNDWTHWGVNSAASFNRKSAVPAQLSNFVAIGTNTVSRYADNFAQFSWTDGTPDAGVTDTATGVYTFGLRNGFELTVPAGPQTRSLKVYTGLYAARGRLQAWLGDFTAPAVTDASLVNYYNNGYTVFTINYAAASPGQKLKLRWTAFNSYDSVFGNVTLQAATLVGIDALNSAPVASNQSVTLPEDTATNLLLTGFDVEGSNLTFTIVSGPTNGIVSGFDTNTGTLTYLPNTNFYGPDSFTFSVRDGQLTSAVATVSLTITPVNDVPVASNQSVTLPEDTATNLLLTGFDPEGSNLTFTVVSGPTNGVLSGFNTNTGALTYLPNTNFYGPDSFTFSVRDGQLTSAVATVSLTITPVNDVPVASNQSVTLPEDTATNLLLTGFDPEGSNLTFTIVSGPTNGIVSGFNTNTGTLTYLPNTNFYGADSFTFSVNDGALTSAVATVSLTITEVSHPTIDIVGASSLSNGFQFFFTTDAGRAYLVEFTDSFHPTNWFFHTNLIGDGSIMSIVIPDITTLTNRFYRLRR